MALWTAAEQLFCASAWLLEVKAGGQVLCPAAGPGEVGCGQVRYSACRAVVVLEAAAQVAGPSAPMTARASPARASRVSPPGV